MNPQRKRDFWISEFNDKNILNSADFINDTPLKNLFYETFNRTPNSQKYNFTADNIVLKELL